MIGTSSDGGLDLRAAPRGPRRRAARGRAGRSRRRRRAAARCPPTAASAWTSSKPAGSASRSISRTRIASPGLSSTISTRSARHGSRWRSVGQRPARSSGARQPDVEGAAARAGRRTRPRCARRGGRRCGGRSARPMPVPSYSSRPCRRANILKIRSCWAGSIPMPLSATAMRTPSPSGTALTATTGARAGARNFTALAIRFCSSCPSWVAVAGHAAQRSSDVDAARRPRRSPARAPRSTSPHDVVEVDRPALELGEPTRE